MREQLADHQLATGIAVSGLFPLRITISAQQLRIVHHVCNDQCPASDGQLLLENPPYLLPAFHIHARGGPSNTTKDGEPAIAQQMRRRLKRSAILGPPAHLSILQQDPPHQCRLKPISPDRIDENALPGEARGEPYITNGLATAPQSSRYATSPVG